jgi:hypothetical protein
MKTIWKANSNSIFIILFVIAQVMCSENLINSLIEVDPSSVDNANQIQGKMEINGVTYNAMCDCNPVTPDDKSDSAKSQTGPVCDPSKLKIHMEKAGKGASYDDIRNLIGNIEDLTYVSVPYTSFKCLDGRHNTAVLATPGGDAGEFILALSVYEDLVGGGRKLSQENVDTFLSQYLKNMPHNSFYMCTDDSAISHIEKDLSV